MTLAQARARVQEYVDDAGATQWTTANINDALGVAQQETAQLLVTSGSAAVFVKRAAVSSNAQGVIDLASLNPMKVLSLRLSVGSSAVLVLPISDVEDYVFWNSIDDFLLAYYERPTFPASDGASFVWGTASYVESNIIDSFMVATAAVDLKVKEGEVNPMLERRREDLRQSLQSIPRIPSMTVMPRSAFGRRNSTNLRWMLSEADKLQIVQVIP